MRRRRPLTYELPPLVDVPTGNVQVVPMQRHDASEAASVNGDGPPARQLWLIHDGHGQAVGPPLESRAAALRQMGALAFRGVELPLTLYGPDGRATGDRLA